MNRTSFEGSRAFARRVLTRIGERTATASKPSRSRPRARCVLIADDETTMLRFGGHVLYEAGICYEGTTSLTRVAEAAARGQAGAVLLDWIWPSGAPLTAVGVCRSLGVPVAIWTVAPDQVYEDVRKVVLVIEKKDREALVSWATLALDLTHADRATTLAASGVQEATDGLGAAVEWGLGAMEDRR